MGNRGGETALRLNPDSEGARRPELARYRPPGAGPYLAALDRAPSDAEALLEAARFYSTGDVAGMSLLWLLMRASMSPDLPMDDSGRIYADVLRRRVESSASEGGRTISIRLAPGEALIFDMGDGRVGAFAHMLEIDFAAALSHQAFPVGFTWTEADVVQTLRRLLTAYREGDSLVHPHAEWVAWAEALERAGHLEAFVARLLGGAMAQETSQAAGISASARAAEAAYVAAHPFRPTRSVLPDDFIPIGAPSR